MAPRSYILAMDLPTILYIKGVKTVPTKTRGDVGKVHCVSEANGNCMEKSTGGKEQGGVFHDSATTRSTFAAFKTHL